MGEPHETRTMGTSFRLLKTSLRLWTRRPGFLVFPGLAFVCLFLFIILLRLVGVHLVDPDVFAPDQHGFLAAALSVLVVLTVMFFEAALVRCVLLALDEKRERAKACLSFALERLPALVGFSSIAFGAAHLFLAMADGRTGAAAVFVRVAWQTWALMIFLVMPVIVVEGQGSWASLRRSSVLFAANWKQVLLADLYIRLISVCLVLAIIGLAAVPDVAGLGLPRGLVAGFLILSFLSISVLATIHRTVLYRFCVDGKIPGSAWEAAEATDET